MRLNTASPHSLWTSGASATDSSWTDDVLVHFENAIFPASVRRLETDKLPKSLAQPFADWKRANPGATASAFYADIKGRRAFVLRADDGQWAKVDLRMANGKQIATGVAPHTDMFSGEFAWTLPE